ncbi:39S ribosomal protein L40, mitochondrial [Sitophilus oryzae]|uniref:Large ribosomal subunit protein mL40 n=1 Tax=Sitophilus oryzae TaxID=7048 RepID=A0A6J2YJV6_SITOR|nr:39S ribosomal protein L40, mitochondrial [Sitophilus oryzae]
MNLAPIILKINRLCLQPTVQTQFRGISTANSLFFKTTPCMLAEPLKRRKRVDPGVVRAREERKKRKLEKQIRRLEKNAKQFKPIEECEVSLTILDEKLERQREVVLSEETLEKRILLEKKWANYKRVQLLDDLQMIDRVMFAQQRALDQLRKESEELYQEAIQPDFHLIPFKSVGPVETPSIEKYDVPDGEYVDISKKWE